MSDMPFPETPRVDALDKVRGRPIFGADDARPGLLHAALAMATIGKGRITALETKAASAVRGVRLVLTHENIGAVKSASFAAPPRIAFGSRSTIASSPQGPPYPIVSGSTVRAGGGT